MPRDGAARVRAGIAAAEEFGWADPDMAVLRLHRRPPPPLPLAVFGDEWGRWIADAAEAAACPPDYVAVPLLASVSAVIGHARWAQATPGWSEPPHLWMADVGDSGVGKSPGADCLLRDVLPEIERRMLADFPDRLREWHVAAELAKAATETWQNEVRTAQKQGKAPPLPPPQTGPEPQAPRLRQNDVTIERVATLLATAAPKGLLIVRDELAGWITGMNAYNDAGRAFWIEAFGGRPYRVERQKHPEPIIVPRLAVSVFGGVQPDRLGPLMREADDGLLARILWAWPNPIPFRLSRRAPNSAWAIEAFDRLRWLDLQPGDPSQPIMVPLADEALPLMEEFGQSIQDRQDTAGGLMRSALGKARGLALRLSLVLELLWWCSQEGMAPASAQISARAFIAAAHLLDDYFLPMADRVYGDAAASPRDRNAATLARWIIRQREQEERPSEVSVRHLQRDVRLPGLTTAEIIHERRRYLGRGRLARKPATRHRTSRTVRLSDQPACLGGRAMSRWAERFTALSRSHDKSDNSDKRSSDDPGGPSVANCQNCRDQRSADQTAPKPVEILTRRRVSDLLSLLSLLSKRRMGKGARSPERPSNYRRQFRQLPTKGRAMTRKHGRKASPCSPRCRRRPASRPSDGSGSSTPLESFSTAGPARRSAAVGIPISTCSAAIERHPPPASIAWVWCCLLDRREVVAIDPDGADLVTVTGARQRFRRRSCRPAPCRCGNWPNDDSRHRRRPARLPARGSFIACVRIKWKADTNPKPASVGTSETRATTTPTIRTRTDIADVRPAPPHICMARRDKGNTRPLYLVAAVRASDGSGRHRNSTKKQRMAGPIARSRQ